MKIEVRDNEIYLKDVFSGVGFESPDGEMLGVCMRDGGFEIHYNNKWWRFCGNEVTCLTPATAKTF